MSSRSGASTPTMYGPRRSARQAGIAPVLQVGSPLASPPLTRGASAAQREHAGHRSRHFQTHALARKGEALPPFAAIHRGQARATTYASRMRLGTTSLMQPLGNQGQAAPAAGTGNATVLGKRQRSAVNYAELQSLDDPPNADLSDESDAQGGTRTRPSTRRRDGDAKDSPPPDRKPATPGTSFLGRMPPPNLITVEAAKKTAHNALCGKQTFVPDPSSPFDSTEDQLLDEADKKPLLVPIRVELETDTHRIRDCFVWNTRDTLITPDKFASIFCEDLGLQSYQGRIAQIIREQITELSGVAEIDVVPPELVDLHVEADLRVIVNLDLQIGTLHLVDTIEWDLSSLLTPEHFANQLCLDLGISGEAAPIIAHAIHEELLRHKRDAIEGGLVGKIEGEGKDKLIVETQALNLRGPRKMEGVWREWNDAFSFGPRVEVFTADDLLDKELEAEKATKRVRRDRIDPNAATSRTTTRPRR